MSTRTLTTAGALACAAVIGLPAGASAAGLDTAVREVRSHTTKADRALDRAEALFERHADRQAARSFALSRREMANARRDAARLRRNADSNRERAAAARAEALVADQQDENVEQLVGVLDEADGRVESRIARAALADTRGRDKAIAVITALIEGGVPSEAVSGLSRALAALSQGHDDEVEDEVDALVSDELSNANARIVARTVRANVDGQSTAAAKLAELIASEDMPAESKPGLQRAYDAVTGEQEQSAETLARFSDRLPAFVRSFVEQIVRQARENAQSMRDNRPTPPAGGPGGDRPGQPEGTPTGQPDGTPTGAPGSTPTGPPAGTPGA